MVRQLGFHALIMLIAIAYTPLASTSNAEDTLGVYQQEFSWDGTSGTFETVNLFQIGTISSELANATVPEILTMGAAGTYQNGYRSLGLPVRYTFFDSNSSSFVDISTNHNDWPSAVRYLSLSPDNVVNHRTEATVNRYDVITPGTTTNGQPAPVGFTPMVDISLANGWSVQVTENYGINGPNPDPLIGWGNEVRITSPAGQTSYVYGDPHLLQANGTQQTELSDLGNYVFALGNDYTLNLSCMKMHDGFSLLTDLTIAGPNGYCTTVGRNGQVKSTGGTGGDFVLNAPIAYYNDPTSLKLCNTIVDYITGASSLVVDFGELTIGDAKNMAVYIYNPTDDVLAAIGGELTGLGFSLLDTAYQTATLGTEEFAIIDVRFEPTELGSYSGQITTDLGFTFDLVGTAVPEPTTIGLMGFAMLGLLSSRRRAS